MTLGTMNVNLILIMIVKILVVLVIGKIIENFILKALDASSTEVTLMKFLKAGTKVGLLFAEALIIAGIIGFDMTSIIAFGSVFAAAFALAASSSLANLFGGVLLLITKPFVVGDYVIAGAVEGIVKEISILNTKLHTLDNKTITVPNGTLSTSVIVNCSDSGKRRVDLVVSSSYDCAVDDVKAAIHEAIANTANVLPEDIFVRVSSYEANVIAYTVRVWTNTADYWQVYFDLLENVKVYFDKNEIKMSYNHIIVHNNNK